MSGRSTKAAADAYVHRLEADLMCDELTATVHRLRELIRDSRSHSAVAFLSYADDIISDLLEVVDRGWTTIEEVAGDLRT
jgi:hypothetical protein